MNEETNEQLALLLIAAWKGDAQARHKVYSYVRRVVSQLGPGSGLQHDDIEDATVVTGHKILIPQSIRDLQGSIRGWIRTVACHEFENIRRATPKFRQLPPWLLDNEEED